VPSMVPLSTLMSRISRKPHHVCDRQSTQQRNTNLLLTEREGRTGEYWPEVVAVRTERSEVRTKTTKGQYSPVRLELARLVSSLLYVTRAMLVLNLRAFEKKKYAAYDRFHGNGPYGEIPTKKEPIRTLGFVVPYNKYILLTKREGRTGRISARGLDSKNVYIYTFLLYL